jgi:hypothetical protein
MCPTLGLTSDAGRCLVCGCHESGKIGAEEGLAAALPFPSFSACLSAGHYAFSAKYMSLGVHFSFTAAKKYDSGNDHASNS